MYWTSVVFLMLATQWPPHGGPRRPSFLLLELVCSMCEAVLSEERLNKQAGPGTKSLPLRDMWQQSLLTPATTIQLWTPSTPTGATQAIPHAPRSEPREGTMEEEGEQILISIH